VTFYPALTSEIQSLSPSAIVELFQLDCTIVGGSVLYFHAGTNQLSGNVIFAGHTYTRYPIHASGFEFSGNSQFPRPKLAVSNSLSAITTLMQVYNDLLGCKVTRIRTLVKFLDAVNFSSGTNLTADPNATFPNDVYYIDRKSMENRELVEFELASSCDLVGVSVPRRQVVQNVCSWKYRGPECGYTGPPLYDANDLPIGGASVYASNLIAATKALGTATTNLNAATQALSAAGQSRDVACSIALVSRNFTYPTYAGSGLSYLTGNMIQHGVFETVREFNGIPAGTLFAIYNGAFVALGPSFRVGAFVYTTSFQFGAAATMGAIYSAANVWPASLRAELISRRLPSYAFTSDCPFNTYSIDYMAVNTGSCSAATGVYTSAQSSYSSASAAYATAVTNYNAASVALPPQDAVYGSERCGKRLKSCKLRFGDTNPLPFGSFPAAGLVR
jgi:lambda family phage minor tail protein L